MSRGAATLAMWLRTVAIAAIVAMASPANAETVAELVQHVCALCHGRDGNSTSPLFPRLSGQRASYIEAQLREFRAHVRADPPAQAFMWGMASQLDDATIAELAKHYASQSPASNGRAVRLSSALGERIYLQGTADGKVAACQVCHGADARGSDRGARLAGQHVEYLVRQLHYFKKRLLNDAPAMVSVCAALNDEQIHAVSAYAAARP